MKRLFFITFLLISISSLAQSTDIVEVRQNMGYFAGNYVLKGKIGGKYAVTMNLKFDYGQVNGTYFYDKYRKKNKIDGNLANLGPMNLIEYDDEKPVGEYIGTFNGSTYVGEFHNYSKDTFLPFVLTLQQKGVAKD